MEFLMSLDFWTALLIIIVIDLVLAGDNAIVIGLAARNLPARLQKSAIVWGTVGAVVIRVLATIFVVYLLKIPGLLFIGGIALLWIAYKLLIDNQESHTVVAASSMAGAIRTIIIADALMGVDNVIAVAGAAKAGSDEHNLLLVILGLLISIPIMVWGSTMIIKLVERFPVTIYIGSAVLVLTAGKMMADEQFLVKPFFETMPILKWLLIALMIVLILWLGWRKNRKTQ